jgi:hypothetical protein
MEEWKVILTSWTNNLKIWKTLNENHFWKTGLITKCNQGSKNCLFMTCNLDRLWV